ncbi:DUF1801 domain-containing protein [Emticicia sp. C21]|uniref:DUF1801 domain-containing protein n=1 Tax=Emticicia sp. C21 TaxID=2302915 RepID=UPI00286DD84F|nr:DUF1801 domain-containing protein [Emticicia sp. C21]
MRTIVLECDLAEELKCGEPCYVYREANIILIHGFKEYYAVLFFKGVLQNDANSILIQQTEMCNQLVKFGLPALMKYLSSKLIFSRQ